MHIKIWYFFEHVCFKQKHYLLFFSLVKSSSFINNHFKSFYDAETCSTSYIGNICVDTLNCSKTVSGVCHSCDNKNIVCCSEPNESNDETCNDCKEHGRCINKCRDMCELTSSGVTNRKLNWCPVMATSDRECDIRKISINRDLLYQLYLNTSSYFLTIRSEIISLRRSVRNCTRYKYVFSLCKNSVPKNSKEYAIDINNNKNIIH